MKKNDIESLIDACLNKDEEAWGNFVSHFKGLVGWAACDRLKRWHIAFTNEDIEDIRQQVFSSIWAKGSLSGVKDCKIIGSWLAVVAGNRAYNYMRTKKDLDPVYLNTAFNQNVTTDRVQDRKDGYAALKSAELKSLISDFIKRLPPQKQAILTLNYIYGKKHREIAEILKIPINTVSTIMKRAKEDLQVELKKKGYENF